MEIKTKFDRGSNVTLLKENKIRTAKVLSITIDVIVGSFDPRIRYTVKVDDITLTYKEEELFKNKQELLDSL